ncbi:hypothetical protein PFISCL1PPCAC_4132 [Pristionchus fissidentatus]|uniref:F-box domain-containing protein n=1 Tax=Pristionchus fissidentatus TaxID=1538716 RepID=A0AAV5V2W9_9BILA|nr:hypothetical protein PFISCL1PPCAC_4132 [Pristionchus fissidentatus]
MESSSGLRACSSVDDESSDEVDYITGQHDDTLFLIFSRLPGGKWGDEEDSALNVLSLTCRRFHELLSEQKNLRRLSNLRTEVGQMSIVQNAAGIRILIRGDQLPGRVSVIHDYRTNVTKRSDNEKEWKILSGGPKAPCELGIPPNLITELRQILMRFNPQCVTIGGTSFLSKQATADLASCLSEFPKIGRLDLFTRTKLKPPGRFTELKPTDLARLVCNFEKLYKIESRFLVNELIQSWISDRQYDNYSIIPLVNTKDIVQCSAISMHNFENVHKFHHELSMVTLSDFLDAVERRPSKGIEWVLSLSCDAKAIDKVIQDKALKLGYTLTVDETWNVKVLKRENSEIQIDWNSELQRYKIYIYRQPYSYFY